MYAVAVTRRGKLIPLEHPGVTTFTADQVWLRSLLVDMSLAYKDATRRDYMRDLNDRAHLIADWLDGQAKTMEAPASAN